MAKMSTAQFREFASAVVRHLPEVDSETGQLLIDEQSRLAAILRGAFKPALVESYRVLLTPSLTKEVVLEEQRVVPGGVFGCLAEMWSEPGTDYHSALITDGWPTEDKEIDFRFFSPGREMSGFEVINEMARLGMRPASVAETIFFACQYSEVLDLGPANFPSVVVLDGGTDVAPGQYSSVEFISETGTGWERGSEWVGVVFPGKTKYTAVAK